MNVIPFVPRKESVGDFMKRYRAECALTGEPASKDKCKSGDPGTITTFDGDVLFVGYGPREQDAT